MSENSHDLIIIIGGRLRQSGEQAVETAQHFDTNRTSMPQADIDECESAFGSANEAYAEGNLDKFDANINIARGVMQMP